MKMKTFWEILLAVGSLAATVVALRKFRARRRCPLREEFRF
jgi:hypothetical protein